MAIVGGTEDPDRGSLELSLIEQRLAKLRERLTPRSNPEDLYFRVRQYIQFENDAFGFYRQVRTTALSKESWPDTEYSAKKEELMRKGRALKRTSPEYTSRIENAIKVITLADHLREAVAKVNWADAMYMSLQDNQKTLSEAPR